MRRGTANTLMRHVIYVVLFAVSGANLQVLAAPGHAAPGQTALQAMLLENPDLLDGSTLSPLEQAVLEVLTPEQYTAFIDGADAGSLVLASGETLADFLSRQPSKGAVAGGLVYFPVPTCTVVRTALSAAGKMAANEVRDVVVRGVGTDLSAQGGSATGCGVPTEAESIVASLQAQAPAGSGRLKAWAADASLPRGWLVDYRRTAEKLKFINSSVIDLCLAAGCAGDFRMRSERAATHVRIEVVGYFAPLAGAGVLWSDGGGGTIFYNAGSVGIGTATPIEALDVNGKIHASGTIASGNSITIDGVTDTITASGGTISFDDDDLITTGTTTTNALTISGLNCAANANSGALTADASGVVSCSDDDAGGGGNTLDAAYDQGGAGAGRNITADTGAVRIAGVGGLELATGDLLQTPGDPIEIGSLGIGESPWSVYVSGIYAYVVDIDSSDLRVIDVSVPSAPRQVGRLLFPGGTPRDVYVAGRHAYVVDSSLNHFKVIDVSDPSAPSQVGVLVIDPDTVSVVVSGRYAYAVDQGTDVLQVIDVSVPSAPSLVSVVSIGAPTDQPISMDVLGSYVYAVNLMSGELKVVDVSVPGAPSQVDSILIGGHPGAVDVSGSHAYVVTSSAFKVVDVSDPGALSIVGSLAIGGNPFGVVVSGNYAYVVDFGSDDLKIIDVSNPSGPNQVGSLSIGTQPRSLFVAGRYAYVTDVDANDLKVIDVSGAEVTSMVAHSLEAGNLQVRNDMIAQGQLQVAGGLNVSAGVFSAGDVGIAGDVMIDGNATVGGDLTVTGSCINCSSDANLKQNIRPLGNALDRISRLRGVAYDWQDDVREARYYPGRQIGVLGQDVEAVFPELVGTDSRGYKFVRYQKLVAPLIEAVKELSGQSERKDAEIMWLTAHNEAMERRLEALERRLK